MLIKAASQKGVIDVAAAFAEGDRICHGTMQVMANVVRVEFLRRIVRLVMG
ncbi:hypothetical protein A2U01_0036705, partial [Trifolium medium]|nr:hypothetical protein [Trifolium medium]